MSFQPELSVPTAQLKERVPHPCEVAQKSYQMTEQRRLLHQVRTTQSWAAAARVSLDQALLLQSRRLGGLPTSHALYHHYNGTDDEIDVEDVYGLAKHNSNVQPAPRALVEKQFYGEELTMKALIGK